MSPLPSRHIVMSYLFCGQEQRAHERLHASQQPRGKGAPDVALHSTRVDGNGPRSPAWYEGTRWGRGRQRFNQPTQRANTPDYQ